MNKTIEFGFGKRFSLTAAVAFLVGVLGFAGETHAQVKITLNPAATHQTITGWEYEDSIPGGPDSEYYSDFIAEFNQYKNTLYDTAHDLGLNRIRLDIDAGIESTDDYWPAYLANKITYAGTYDHPVNVVSSDPDPNVINWDGFHFAQLDWQIANKVMPLKQRVEADGEKFYINGAYGAFGTSPAYLHLQPPFYARFVLAVFLHMQQTFGFVPDTWEMVNEPDNPTPWNGQASLMGQAMVATAAKLATYGFHPTFVVPSTLNYDNAVPYFNEIIAVQGALPVISELSYHRYAGTESTLSQIASTGLQYGVTTGMNECAFCTGDVLTEDLKVVNASTWEQFALNGIQIDASGNVSLNSDAADFRQYFKYIRSGAVRIDASSDDTDESPVAFINTNGKYVVVTRVGWTPGSGQDLAISGLPAGTYGIRYTLAGMNSSVDLPDYTVTNGMLMTSVPGGGVITVYGKAGSPGGEPGAPTGVEPVDFVLGPAGGASTSATITAGQTAIYNLQLNPSNGLTGQVTLSCTGVPAQTSCTLSSRTVGVNGSSTPFNVIVSTTARSAFLPAFPGPLRPFLMVRFQWFVLLLIGLASASLVTSRRHRRRAVFAALLVSLAFTLVSCTSGVTSSTLAAGSTGTPSGTYTLTVTGALNGVSRNVSLTLTVK